MKPDCFGSNDWRDLIAAKCKECAVSDDCYLKYYRNLQSNPLTTDPDKNLWPPGLLSQENIDRLSEPPKADEIFNTGVTGKGKN